MEPPPRGGLAGTLSPDAKDAEVIMQVAKEAKYLQGELTHFLECVESRARPLTDGLGSLQGLRVIWALEQAEKEDRIADLRGLGIAVN